MRRALLMAAFCGGATAQTVAAPAPTSQTQQHSSAPPNSTSPFATPAVIEDELRFGAAFPQFESKDIAGRTWRTEDLGGKFTILYLFHTLQAHVPPVARDLRELQRFHEKVGSTGSIRVLTFCTDYDYTHAAEFMAKNKFTFPVIANWALVAKLFPKDDCRQPCYAGVPTATGRSTPIAAPQWVVDPAGRLSYPTRSWNLARVLREVEKIARAK